MYDPYFALLCSNKIQAFNIHVCIYLHFRILILYNLYSFKHYVRDCTKIRLYMYTFTICWLRGWCDAILIKTKQKYLTPFVTIRHRQATLWAYCRPLRPAALSADRASSLHQSRPQSWPFSSWPNPWAWSSGREPASSVRPPRP